MSTKTYISVLVILLSGVLIGCSPGPIINDGMSPAPAHPETGIMATGVTAVAQATVRLTPANMLAPTVTATAAPTMTATPTVTTTPSPMPSPTATATPYPTNFSTFCGMRELERVDHHTTGISGFLAYVVLENQTEVNQTGLIGGEPLQTRSLPPESNNITIIGFSPNGSWFAYIKESTAQPGVIEPYVYLLSIAGETSRTPMPPEMAEGKPYSWITWISDELLMLQYISLPASGFGSYMVDSYSIFNAFTGEERNDILDSLLYWDEWRTPYFSPDMMRVLYLAAPSSQVGQSVVLWDIEERAILWTKPFRSVLGIAETSLGGGFFQVAFWSPDSQAFVFTTGEQTTNNDFQYASYLVDRNGLEERLLLSSSDLAGVMALGGYWSPDKRFIYSSYRDTFVYDLATNQVVTLCSDDSLWDWVAWSPDGQYLAYVGSVGGENHLLLFSVSTSEVTSLGKIRKIASLLQWLENEAWLHSP